jgi:hypothetical protein
MPELIAQDNYVKILENDANDRADKGVSLVQTLVLAGQQYNNGILGAYAIVKAQYDATGTAIPADRTVTGDTTGFRYRLLLAGDPAVDPENDTNVNPVTGVGDNWQNLEIAYANNFAQVPTNRDYYTETGVTTDDYALASTSPSIAIEEYAEGMGVVFIPSITNAGPVTLNIDGLGAKDVVDKAGDPLAGSDLIATIYNEFRFDQANDRFVVNTAEVTGTADIYKINRLSFTPQDMNGVVVLNDTVTINPGSCYNHTYQEFMQLTSVIAKSFSTNWSEGDTGGMKPVDADFTPNPAFPTNWAFAHVFLITKLDGTADIGTDDNRQATNLLNNNAAGADGYVFYRRLLSLPVRYSVQPAIQGYYPIRQTGDNFIQSYRDDPWRTSILNDTTSTKNFLSLAPEFVMAKGKYSSGGWNSTGSTLCLAVAETGIDAAITPFQGTSEQITGAGAQGVTYAPTYVEAWVDGDQALAVYNNGQLAGGSNANSFWHCLGWYDNRGQDGIMQ